MILGNSGGKGNGPGGLDTVQREWDGYIVLETEWVQFGPALIQMGLTLLSFSVEAHPSEPQGSTAFARP